MNPEVLCNFCAKDYRGGKHLSSLLCDSSYLPCFPLLFCNELLFTLFTLLLFCMFVCFCLFSCCLLSKLFLQLLFPVLSITYFVSQPVFFFLSCTFYSFMFILSHLVVFLHFVQFLMLFFENILRALNSTVTTSYYASYLIFALRNSVLQYVTIHNRPPACFEMNCLPKRYYLCLPY